MFTKFIPAYGFWAGTRLCKNWFEINSTQMNLAWASWETRFWHAWWPHMRGTPAEAAGCFVENHAELVGSDNLVIEDSQGNVVWDGTGCSSIHAPSSWQGVQKGVPRLDLYAQWSDARSVCFLNALVRARMCVFSSPAAGVCSYMGIRGGMTLKRWFWSQV